MVELQVTVEESLFDPFVLSSQGVLSLSQLLFYKLLLIMKLKDLCDL